MVGLGPPPPREEGGHIRSQREEELQRAGVYQRGNPEVTRAKERIMWRHVEELGQLEVPS